MIEQPGVALVVRCVLAHGVEVGDEWHLGVDDDLLLARQPHDDVRPQYVAVRVARRALLVEVAVLDHPRHLDDPLELDLSPATADVRSAQGGDEVSGLDAEAIMIASQLTFSVSLP